MTTEGRKPGFVGKKVEVYQGVDEPLGPDLFGPVEVLDVDGDWVKVRNTAGRVVYFDGRRAAGIVPVEANGQAG
jgi:hypothetical protein